MMFQGSSEHLNVNLRTVSAVFSDVGDEHGRNQGHRPRFNAPEVLTGDLASG